ncbi:unnamed protein product [Cunninghamella blakesleeana]
MWTTNRTNTQKRKSAPSHIINGTNIQVVLRCRGRNEAELAADSPVILEATGRREVLLTTSNKVFTFDCVFDEMLPKFIFILK